MKTTIAERIRSLREEMKNHQIDGYIIPGSDPHLSEYPPARWKSRQWISGFTGSAGTIVITSDKAGLWTDSRYFLQAAEQLEGTGVELYKMGLPDVPSLTDFLLYNLKPGQTVGVNGDSYSVNAFNEISGRLNKKEILIETDIDLVNHIWEDRPGIPDAPIFELPVEITGISTSDKLDAINNKLRESRADCTVLCALDDIAWTFNIRGNDVNYNPVAVSYAFISEEESVLFIPAGKLTFEIAENLKRQGVKLADYSLLIPYLKKLKPGSSILIDAARTNVRIYKTIEDICEIIPGTSPATILKSIKNKRETEGFRQAVIKDGVAMTRFLLWLEKAMASGTKITEMSASRKLTEFRAEQPLYIMDSFESIFGYAGHGAIVHYAPTPESETQLLSEGLLLMDSGGQYLDGTTDITRTIALGEPTEQMKKDFTKILKGMISLSKSKFPAGTRGCQLDILARKALWDSGINYLHGTGHGIGHCLNVHEGPQNIRMEENPTRLQPGMVLSNEPGIYRTDEYGIRTENMILVQEDSETEFGKFYSFETLTLCYIDTRLVIPSMLSAREHAWLNKYHQRVYDQLSPFLNEEEKEWLKEKTKEI